ncbi:hypothetical protein M0C40_09685 [Spiroplasma citri]|uniref:Plectrovirus-related protein n=1 Tax=Spiroplasma citri TaxID=2133 RepID=A0AAX3SYG3_SPICI|nr:hypothetical protein [Spiroplasma citri]WFG96326.1 hypothetical protein M0C40_09685 [Spiroplasma citri]
MDIKFKTTKEYKKIKKNFIIRNFVFGFVYFQFFIVLIEIIVGLVLFSNREIIVGILLFSLFLFLIFILLFFIIQCHICEIKEYKVMLLKKRMLPLENIIGGLGKGTMLRPVRRGDDKIE